MGQERVSELEKEYRFGTLVLHAADLGSVPSAAYCPQRTSRSSPGAPMRVSPKEKHNVGLRR